MKKLLFILVSFSILFTCITCRSRENNIIQIGAILPITGSASYAAEFMKKGLEMAVEEINQKSSIKYEIVYEDSKALSKDGLNAYKKLRMKGIKYIVCAISNVGMAIAPQTKNEDVILFGTAIIPSEFVTNTNRAIRLYPNAQGMTKVIAKHNFTTLNSKRSAVIYINNDMGRDCNTVYNDCARQYNAEVVYTEAYEPNQTDFKNIITKISNKNIDCIYISGFGDAYLNFIKQVFANPLTKNIHITGDMTFSLPNTKETIGEIPYPIFYADGTLQQTFIMNYENKYKETVSSYAGYTYAIPYLIKEAIDNGCRPSDINSIYNYITSHSYDSCIGKLSFENNGESNLHFDIKTLQ